MDRKRFGWKVHLLNSREEPVEYEIYNYWSPNYDGVETEIGLAARAELHMKSGKQLVFTPISVEPISATL